MFGYGLGEFAFGELPVFDSAYLRLIRDPVSRLIYLVEIYPYEF